MSSKRPGVAGGPRGPVKRRPAASPRRRDELLAIAARLFAAQGYLATSVREIADAAGILSGSLYHHFDSKESLADELLRGLLAAQRGGYQQVLDEGGQPREMIAGLLRTDIGLLDTHLEAIAVFQAERRHLARVDRFAYLDRHRRWVQRQWATLVGEGQRAGVFRQDFDGALLYRVAHESVWNAAHWFNPRGRTSGAELTEQYLDLLFRGLLAREDDEIALVQAPEGRTDEETDTVAPVSSAATVPEESGPAPVLE
ncbi:TetR/AcrR family transcriptional regulator [Actinoalloteichus hymeniacidonis]|uniref:Transcriptional regulator, TetR family n=1 Tax=Actinoalloteichus hymeniacidonis TaxID=340345 RepID=A0AAC9MZW4_9PSEU|nr:TetR/AcrR family transcriptional regulator [Actinoalloteichus hymeniacidonis]AOS64351.1 transcriptional regulator, TetR family [Actinoalloteichus hymeniacidonis]MBB5907581.1 AcrR family transcriptional regulator [Actinoalloteichus hymeniacidonis]